MRTVAFGPLLGENNRLPDNRLSTKGGSFLRSAVNVDLTFAKSLPIDQQLDSKRLRQRYQPTKRCLSQDLRIQILL